MNRLVSKIRRSLDRDRDLPLSVRIAKGRRYLAASALAPFYFRDCDSIGDRARAIGRPRIENEGRLEIGDDLILNSKFSPTELVSAPTGKIEIGNRVSINYGTAIHARQLVRLGDGVSIGPYSVIADSEFMEADADSATDGDVVAPVEIGENVWLASRVTVLPGSRIGAGSVITAGSIVSGEIPPGVVAGGIPARVLRRIHGDPAEERQRAEAPASPACENVLARAAAAAAVAPQAANAALTTAAAPNAPGVPPLRGVVLADFTIGDLAVRLRDAADAPSMIVEDAPYGQVVQSLLQPAPEGAGDFAIVWTRPEMVSPAFQRILAHEAATAEELLADVDSFAALLTGAPRYRFTFVPTWTAPASHRGLGMADCRPGGVTWALSLMNNRLMEKVGAAPTVFVLNAQRWLEAAGRGGSSAKAWYLGKIAFQGEVLAEAVKDIKAAVRGLTGQARKLLVLDLDDTLWGGIVGDAGWENLRLGGHDAVGEAFVDFQRLIKNLTRRGIVLGIVSKNTESVAMEAIKSHPEMVLKAEDFVGWRINWNDKARNVADLAAELNLGLQSVVFIDDNPIERARVREALPEVLVPEWPEEKLHYPSAFLALRCFDTPSVSREDAERTQLYAAEQRRETLKQDVGSLDEWLMSLDLRVRVEPVAGANVARTVQLLNKTNQMNLSTRRLTEAELLDWAKGPGRALWAVSVSDRFGDAGLTGILSAEMDGDVCRVVDFVLSCRVMGRRVEETLAHLVVSFAREMGARTVEANYLQTKKNKPCHDFWKGSGFASSDDATRFTWDLARDFPLPGCITLTAER